MTAADRAVPTTWLFDCDGVLLDSNAVKTNAFATAVEPYGPAAVRAVVDHHVANGGVSRFEKFDRLFTDVLRRVPEPGERDRLLDVFSATARAGLETCAVDPSAAELLGELADRGIPAYVVTGGATEEVRDVLAHHGLLAHFGDVFGSPSTKSEILADLAARSVLGDAAFVGDSRLDMDVAAVHRLRRFFVTHWSEFEQWPSYAQANPDVEVVDDLGEILQDVRRSASPGARTS